MLVKKTVEEFNRILGSDSPAPGGGSVAALSGSLGAELVAMVCRLTMIREEYKEFYPLIQETMEAADKLAQSLTERIDLDTQAFNGVMAAFKMPKATDEEKKLRSAAIQEGYKEAIQSPYSIAKECVDVLRLASAIIGKSNVNALSDLGVAAWEAKAGLEGAVMNMRINFGTIKDKSYVDAMKSEIDRLLEEGSALWSEIDSFVQKELA